MYTVCSSLEFCITERPARRFMKGKNFVKGKNWNKCETETLIKHFHTKAYPEREEIYKLAKSLNTSCRKIRIWFNKMRHRKRAKGMLIEGV